MKPYSEVIKYLKKQVNDKYLNGSNDTRPDGVEMVAYIYEKPYREVMSDIYTK